MTRMLVRRHRRLIARVAKALLEQDDPDRRRARPPGRPQRRRRKAQLCRPVPAAGVCDRGILFRGRGVCHPIGTHLEQSPVRVGAKCRGHALLANSASPMRSPVRRRRRNVGANAAGRGHAFRAIPPRWRALALDEQSFRAGAAMLGRAWPAGNRSHSLSHTTSKPNKTWHFLHVLLSILLSYRISSHLVVIARKAWIAIGNLAIELQQPSTTSDPQVVRTKFAQIGVRNAQSSTSTSRSAPAATSATRPATASRSTSAALARSGFTSTATARRRRPGRSRSARPRS